MKFCRNVVLFSIILSLQFHAKAQSTIITGKIVKKDSQESIAFAHIFIEGTRIGTISDLYGNFSLSIPPTSKGSNLTITCLGYKSVVVPPRQAATSPLLITLEQDAVELQEVVVRPLDPVKLLEEAVRRIPENYDTTLSILSGYYNVSVKLEDKNARYTEAFLDVYKLPYKGTVDKKKFPGDSILIKHIRTKPNELNDWKLSVMLPWESRIFLLEFRDIVKESCCKQDGITKFISAYTFEIEKLVMINGRSTFMIKLIPKKGKRNSYWNGYIYIDEETRAFVKIDFVSTEKLFRKLTAEFSYQAASKLYAVRYVKGELKESISYEMIEGKWYFKEVNSSKHFLISSRKRNMDEVPVNVTLHYHTDSIQRNTFFHDTLQFLSRDGRKWDQYFRQRYDTSFWRSFDEQRGVLMSDSLYTAASEVITPGQPPTNHQQHIFTRADTLRGKLTPLRSNYDVSFYHLDVDVDMENQSITGSNKIRLVAVEPFEKIQVDLYANMTIEKIVCDNVNLSHEREYDAVYIEFPQPVRKGETKEIVIHYSGTPKVPDFNIPMNGGFLWGKDYDGNPWAQVVCQGSGASLWWPNKDHLSDEPDSMKIWITVPKEFTEISNGRLKRKTPMPENKTRYEWYVSYPINNYNVTLNIGKYAHFSDQYISEDTLSIDYYVMAYNRDASKELFKHTKPMLQCFEKYFGKYPFPRDGFTLVESLYPMEHQSGVCIGMIEEDNIDAALGLMWHESAHEWWGNSVSCTDMADLWIHEAFATYAEALAESCQIGEEVFRDYIPNHRHEPKNTEPIVGIPDVNHIFYDIGDMYSKGSLMLHTFRNILNNDALFFRLLIQIQKEFKYQTVTTADLVNFINKETKTDYTYFFDQYLKNTSVPRLEVRLNQQASALKVDYRWKADVSNFRMPVKVKTGKSKFEFIHPETDWKSIILPAMNQNDFEVDERNFYIDVSFITNTTNRTGKVIDAKTLTPLPYATVQVEPQGISVITNQQGFFTISITERAEDTLTVSVVGYKSFKIPVSLFPNKEMLTVKLQTKSYLLQEVTITDNLDANEIIKRVAKYRLDNYPATPFIKEGFYRETQMANGKYVSLLEAVIQVYNDGYKLPKKEQIKVNHLRKTEEYIHAFNAEFWNSTNLVWGILNEDHIKYHLKDSKKQTFEREANTSIGDIPVFVIITKSSFWPLRYYVQMDNYAVLRIEHEYVQGKTWGLKKQKARVDARNLMVQYDFKRYGDLYYPDRIAYQYAALFTDQENIREPLEWEIRQELIFTDIKTESVKEFDPIEIISNDASLWKLQHSLNETFWNDYPVLQERSLPEDVKKDLGQILLDLRF